MSADPVCKSVKKNRPFLFLNKFFLAFECINNRKRIIPVNTFGMHHFRIYTGTDASKNTIAHCLAHSLSAHAVKVVHEVEYQRQSAFIFTFPEGFVLVHRGKADPLPYRSAA